MIEFSHVTAGYAGKKVLQNFSLSLPDTGAVALMAPSGYGKTTLLRLMAGFIRPETGEIKGLGDYQISFLFQEDRLLPWLTALENVRIVGREEDARRWLNTMEIEDVSQYPREMSGGMQRRVALARAMTYGGNLLLLDEPFKGLDEALRSRIAGKIRGQAQLTVLSVHDEEEAQLMDAKVIHLDEREG